MKTNHVVTGRVPPETIDKLFQLGMLSSPSEVEKILHKYRKDVILKGHRWLTKEYYAVPKWQQFFKTRPEVSFRDRIDLDCPITEWLSVHGDKELLNYAYAVEDIRKVIEVLSVAKNSLGQTVHADNVTLCTLKRVCENEDYYINLSDYLLEYLEDK